MVWSAVIPAAASLVGGFMANRSREEAAAQANVASAESVAKQIEFQREMSNTSYQRAVADMRAAGINPMLAALKGGASTPTGAAYQAQMPQVYDIATPAVQAGAQFMGSSAAAAEAQARMPIHEQMAKKIAEEIKNIPLEGERIKEATYMLWSQSKLLHEQGATQREQQKVLTETVKKLQAETGLLNNQAVAEAALDNLGREVKQLQPIIDLLKPFIGRRF